MQRQNFEPGQKLGIFLDDVSESFRTYLQNFVHNGEQSELAFYTFITSNVCTDEDRCKLTGEKVNGMFYQVLGLERYSAIFDYYFNANDATRLRIESLYFNIHGLSYKTLLRFLNRRFRSWCRRNRPEINNFPPIIENYHREPDPIVHLPYMPDFEGLQLAADGIGILTATGVRYDNKPLEDEFFPPPPSNIFYDPEGRVGVYSEPVNESLYIDDQARCGSISSDEIIEDYDVVDDVEEMSFDDIILSDVSVPDIRNIPLKDNVVSSVNVDEGAYSNRRLFDYSILNRSLELRNRKVIFTTRPKEVKMSKIKDDLGPSASFVPDEPVLYSSCVPDDPASYSSCCVKRLRVEKNSWKVRKKDNNDLSVTD